MTAPSIKAVIGEMDQETLAHYIAFLEFETLRERLDLAERLALVDQLNYAKTLIKEKGGN